MRNLSLPLALVLFSSFVACSGSEDGAIEHVAKGASAVQGGQSDTTTAHNFAVGIANREGAVCTGTLIAPNLVMTARHCVVPPGASEAVTCADKFGKNIPAADLFVTTNPNLFSAVRTKKNMYPAKEIITPDDTSFCGNDIALVILQKSIPDSEATPATPVVQFSMTDRSKIGAKVVAMGYGITSPSANDSGQRRMRENIEILCIPGDKQLDCSSGRMKSMIDSDKEFVTEGWVCSGDSGGGAFDQTSFESGTPFVLGALSRGPQTDTECLAAIYSRTDAHADMIIDAGKKAAQLGGYEEPTWVNPLAAQPDPADPTTGDGCEGDTCTDTSATEPGPVVTKTTTTTGCSTSGAPAGSSDFAAVGFAVAALFASRRRRR